MLCVVCYGVVWYASRYVKRSTDRFIELGITTMRVCKFDVEKYIMPPQVQ